jgi:hypothetical protein
MKQFAMFLFMCILPVSYVYSQELRKLNENELDPEKAKFTENFARSFLNELKNNSSYKFSGEATDIIAEQMTPGNQQQMYKQLKSEYGDFVSLAYAETWKLNDGKQDLYIYRMKTHFASSENLMEFRVVLNKDGKIAGIWVAPWKDSLN